MAFGVPILAFRTANRCFRPPLYASALQIRLQTTACEASNVDAIVVGAGTDHTLLLGHLGFAYTFLLITSVCSLDMGHLETIGRLCPGVVGLAIARSLAQEGREVIVLESASQIGTSTSSRNSEVIHAGA